MIAVYLPYRRGAVKTIENTWRQDGHIALAYVLMPGALSSPWTCISILALSRTFRAAKVIADSSSYLDSSWPLAPSTLSARYQKSAPADGRPLSANATTEALYCTRRANAR